MSDSETISTDGNLMFPNQVTEVVLQSMGTNLHGSLKIAGHSPFDWTGNCTGLPQRRNGVWPPLWLPRQPAARHSPATLLSTTRPTPAIADPTRTLPSPGTEPALALSQNVAAPCWSSRDLPLPSSNSVLHPFAPEPLHESTITISFTRCLSPSAPVVRSSGPQTR
jgi:hypothetical protein